MIQIWRKKMDHSQSNERREYAKRYRLNIDSGQNYFGLIFYGAPKGE